MKRHQFFHAGQEFRNANGSTYKVLNTTNDNDETLVLSKGGWVCMAHDIALLDDGTYEWARSDGWGFLNLLQSDLEEWAEMNGRDIIGGLSLYTAPWWEEADGAVLFTDHDGTIFYTDGIHKGVA